MSRRHESRYDEYLKQKEKPLVSSEQLSIASFVTSTGELNKKYGSQNPRQRLLIESLVKNVIINCALPVAIVDNQHFRQFLTDIDPKFSPPCRQTVTSSFLPQYLKEKKAKLEDLLKQCSDVALTTDAWTDRRAHAFLGVTVHKFVSGKNSSHLLAFRTLPGSHTGQRIAEELEAIINEFGLQNKVRFIVSDNASNMKKAMHLLFEAISDDDEDGNTIDNYFDDPSLWQDNAMDDTESETHIDRQGRRIPCFAHSLQLVVRDGLQTVGLAKRTLAKCTKLASLVHQSALFRSSFERTFGSGRSIPSSNETRWNSTLHQLKAILDLDQAKLTELLQETTQDSLLLSAKDLQQIQELVDILSPFAEATDLTQGDKTITVSCVIPIVLSLNKMLKEKLGHIRSFQPLVRALITSMNDRFSGLLEKLGIHSQHASAAPDLSFSDDVFLMATALDPKFAFHWLQDHPGSQQEQEILRLRITGQYH